MSHGTNYLYPIIKREETKVSIWNGSTGGGITQAEAQAACTAAINAADLPTTAEVETAAQDGAAAAIVAADLPDTAEVQAAAQLGAGDAITAANLPDQTEVQTACEDAITASVGAEIPTVVQIQTGIAKTSELQPAAQAALTASVGTALITAAQVTAAVPSVAAIQSGLATSTAVGNLQTSVNALPSNASITTACGSAITSAAGVAIPSVAQNQAGLATSTAVGNVQTTVNALPSASTIVSAITASGAISTQQEASAAAAITASTLVADTVQGVDDLGISQQASDSVTFNAIGFTPLRATNVVVSGAGTTGTLITSPGGGLKIYVTGFIVSCTVAQSTWTMGGTGASAMGTHSLLQNNCMSLFATFGYLLSSGAGANLTYTKTTGATLTWDIWYYTAA